MLFTILATIVVAVIIYDKFFKSSNEFWERHGLQEIDTSPALSKLDLLLGRKVMFAADDYVYQQLGSDKFGGMMDMGKPAILIKDVNLIKKILIKDFEYFSDRRDFVTEQDAALKRMLPNLDGEEWKGVRASVSPVFTTGKIRRMMEYFNSVGKEWVDDLRNKAKSGGGSVKIADMTNTVNQYTVDVIASAVFGINAGAIKNPNSQFFSTANQLANFNKFQPFKISVLMMLPRLYKLFNWNILDKTAIGFFEGILEQGLKSRIKGESKRNDFLQLLVEAKKGELKAMGNDELSTFEKEAQLEGQEKTEKKQWLTDQIMNSQSLVFFFAGYASTSNFISFVIYVLAAHQDVQGKVRDEVAKIAKDDTFDYDDLGQLVYLDMVINEVNRMYPSAGRLERKCVKAYKDATTGLSVPKGAMVIIPMNALHHDKKYYENPDVFYPEHFCPSKKADRSPYVYLPFGGGPRNCIGMRFALIEAKAAVAHLVHNFVIEPTEKTPLPVQARPGGRQLLPPTNLELKLTPIK